MSVQEVLLVSQEKMTAYTNLNQNLSPDLLLQHVYNAQNTYLINLIGSSFYRELKDQVRSNSVTPANKLFLDDYVGNVVLNYAFFMAIPYLKYKFFNKSVLSPKSETADSTTLEEIQFLMREVRNVADQYAMLLQRFLYYHSNEYPLWNSANLKDGVIPNKSSPFISPLVTLQQPYAWKKRLGETMRTGSYGYTLQGDIVGGPFFLQCDFPWWAISLPSVV